ncbi:LuxR C-terminal-related transcriptional regulator [Streptomyces sp. NPDC047123]|uniref:helix-turn-helix transcriptional regulator n=1 Tax=Streptomyces sp. NPDC047123 TaxID=3155622 RepID=UPI0033FB4CC2
MIAVRGSAGRPLVGVLADERADPVLLFVEGVAGGGKSHLLQELACLPKTADVTRLWWRCGAGGEPPHEDENRPALWLVDDVQRADEDELRWLRQVLARLRPGSAAVVAYRPEELRLPGVPLGAPPVAYPSGMTVLRHRLAPWDEERVRRAAAEALGDRISPEGVRRLHERTGGVPQVVVDVLAVLREQRPACTGTAADVDAVGAPVRLAELVLSRVHALSPEDRPVAWAAAVVDGPAGRDELVAVSGIAAAQGRTALLRALEGATLTELGEDRYGFAVPLAASVVRDSLAGPVRQDLHGRAAKALSRRQPVPWAAVAGHHRAAGDSRRWITAVEKAAGTAASASRHQEAIALLERTLATPGLSPQVRARLAPLLARSAVTGLRSDQTVEVLAQIVQDASLPAAVRGELRLDLGLMLSNQVGRYAEGWRALETAAVELREVRPGLAARAMGALSSPFWPDKAVGVHREWLVEAMAAADASGDDAMRTAVLANRVALAMSCADDGAWELVCELPRDTSDPARAGQAARGLCNAADSAVWLGLHERAPGLLAEGRELSARSGAPYFEHNALGAQLLQEWWTGQWPGLAKRCEDFVAATADMPLIASDASIVRGLLAVAQGEWGEAVSWLSPCGASHAGSLPVPLVATAAGALIRLALARQETKSAAEQARVAWAVVAGKGVWPWAAELAPWAVEALVRAGDGVTAHAMVRDLSEGLGPGDAPAAQAALVWCRAVLAETQARDREGLSRAAELYRQAAAAYGQLPRPYTQAVTVEAAGRCVLAAHAAAGPGPDGGSEHAAVSAEPAADCAPVLVAVAELESCAQRFTDLGAVWDAARARALLRTRQPARRNRPPGRPSHADELSPREAEVAQLAVRGLTNREIASTLHLSPRTVEQHIARAMRKTGALSRRDLAHRLGGDESTSACPSPGGGPPVREGEIY